VPLINCGTSFLAGLVVFSVLGNMSANSGIAIDDMSIEGTGLAFVVYPAALSSLPASPLFAILFFLMLLCLGLDSQFSMVETILTYIVDAKIGHRFKRAHRSLALCVAMVCMYLYLSIYIYLYVYISISIYRYIHIYIEIYVVYPAALSSLPALPLFAILFFLMLLCLGLDSQFSMVETILTYIVNAKIGHRFKRAHRSLALCVVMVCICIYLFIYVYIYMYIYLYIDIDIDIYVYMYLYR